jgi:GTP:adenosylcobinamide-phosphate guanylyltransferase
VADALILAGGEIEAARFPHVGTGIIRKAQLPVMGRPMVEWTARGVRACRRVERLVVVGHEILATRRLGELGARLVPEGGSIAGNLAVGLKALPGARRVLAVSADLPLVTGEALEDFVDNAPDADLVFPYVERADAVRDFPDRAWVFAETPEGAFTGAAPALFRPETLLANWEQVEEALDARRPLALARRIGPWFALRFLLRQLRVAEVEASLSGLLRLTVRGYRTAFSELALDVDRSSDVGLVEAALGTRGIGTERR